MASKNKLLSILTVLIANPAYAAMDCNNQPSCTTLGYSKENVAGCASDGYIFCPFDTSYKKCIANTIRCPANASSCTHHIRCNNNVCQVAYYNCEDAGYFPSVPGGGSCNPNKVTITLRNGSTKTCYADCRATSNASCNSEGYYSPGSCSDRSLDWINIYLPTSGTDLNCEMCVGSDYKTSAQSKIETITIASMDEKACQDKYVLNLESSVDEDDCSVYI